jgi:hypothetical protein
MQPWGAVAYEYETVDVDGKVCPGVRVSWANKIAFLAGGKDGAFEPASKPWQGPGHADVGQVVPLAGPAGLTVPARRLACRHAAAQHGFPAARRQAYIPALIPL